MEPIPPQPPVPPFVPPPPQVKKSPKLLYILLILVFLSASSVFAYKYYQLKQQLAQTSPTPSASIIPTTDLTTDWKTYQNDQYNFEVKYHPESNPNELIGNNEVGQFSYLFKVNFGTNPLTSQYGYELKINNQKSLDDYRTELVGHITDTIDSEEEIVINNNTWKKINYQVFLTTDNVSITTAIIESKIFSYTIMAATIDIDKILSTFKFTNSISPELTAEQDATLDPTANWKTYKNTAGYSIKYPESFTTQLIAAGSGRAEANSTTRSLFIYKSDSTEPYFERNINLELFQDKPTYYQGIITETILDNRTVEKIIIPNAPFDIYLTQVGTEEFLEIYVANDPLRKEITYKILSTFKFTN